MLVDECGAWWEICDVLPTEKSFPFELGKGEVLDFWTSLYEYIYLIILSFCASLSCTRLYSLCIIAIYDSCFLASALIRFISSCICTMFLSASLRL